MRPGVEPEADTAVRPGLRERKRLRTRQAILDAAWILFTRNGAANTPVRAIAEDAEVSEVTVYNYFESRADIVAAVMDRHVNMERTVAGLAAVPEHEGPIGALRVLNQSQLEATQAEFRRTVKNMRLINGDPLLRGAYRSQQTHQIEILVDALLPRAKAIGMSRPDLHLLCVAWLGIVDGLSELPDTLKSPKAWVDACDRALTLLAGGWER